MLFSSIPWYAISLPWVLWHSHNLSGNEGRHEEEEEESTDVENLGKMPSSQKCFRLRSRDGTNGDSAIRSR